MEDKSINVGKVAMTMGGNYDPSKAYDKLVCVNYNYRSWVSKKPVSEGIVPSEANSAFWQMISDRGERGPQGQSYVDKELVPIVDNLTTGGSANVLSAEQGKVLKQELTELESEVIKRAYKTEYDVNDFEDKLMINANGQIESNAYFRVLRKLLVSEGDVIETIGVVSDNAVACCIAAYDANGNFLSDKSIFKDTSNSKKYVVSEGVAYLSFSTLLSIENVKVSIPTAITFNTLKKDITKLEDDITILESDIYNVVIGASDFIDGIAINYSDGTEQSNAFYKSTNFIDVLEGRKIELTDCICDYSGFATLSAYNGSTYMQSASINTNSLPQKTYTVPSGVNRIRVSTLKEKTDCQARLVAKYDVSKIEPISKRINYFAECTTESINGQKRIYLDNYERSLTNRIIIKMQFANNSTDACYLQVNEGENINLFYNGKLAIKGNSWSDGDYIEVFFDGTQYQSTRWECQVERIVTPKFLKGTIASIGQKVIGLDTYNRTGCCISVGIDGILAGIDINCGRGRYYGGYIHIDTTKVEVYRYESYKEDGSWKTGDHLLGTYLHNIEFGTRTNIQVIGDSLSKNAKLIITTINGGNFVQEIDWFLAGKIEVVGTAQQNLSVTLCDILTKDIKKDLWLIGDSYLSYEDHERWTYWMHQYGLTNFAIQNLPGGTSSDMITSFKNSLEVYAPKKAVWLVGMNDASDVNDAPNPTWLSNTQAFLDLCNEYGIEPILSTIPSVTLPKYHDAKSTWVRNSKKRFIDVAYSVGSNSNGEWWNGLLSSDKVHPSELGAKVIASRVMVDLPEILES